MASDVISISGRTKDVSFFAGALRGLKIPYGQALAFGHTPILQIPQRHADQVHALIAEHKAAHPIYVVGPDELRRARDMFVVMVVAVVGILAITWISYLVHRFHR